MAPSYERASTRTGFTVVRPNEVFTHVDVMARELYGGRGDYGNTLLALGIQFLPSFAELSAAFPHSRPIGYQLEQLYDGAESVERNLLEWSRGGAELWDYDLDNVEFLARTTGVRPAFRPLLFAQSLRRLRNRRRPRIDVLFYGSRNDRREQLVDRIRAGNRRRRIVWFHGLGRDLDEQIERSKIVLNLHYYEAAIQEQPRIFYLLINGKCVLSESSVRNYYGDMIVERSADSLPDAVAHLLEHDRWRAYADAAPGRFRVWSEHTGFELGL